MWVREFLFGSWIGDFERSRPHLVGDPISTNTLLEELFASLGMPDLIAPVERVPSSYTKCFS
jgi:hypothetical protein